MTSARHQRTLRPNSWTTIATYAALSFAGGVSFFVPERITDAHPLVPKSIAIIEAAAPDFPGVLAQHDMNTPLPPAMDLTGKRAGSAVEPMSTAPTAID